MESKYVNRAFFEASVYTQKGSQSIFKINWRYLCLNAQFLLLQNEISSHDCNLLYIYLLIILFVTIKRIQKGNSIWVLLKKFLFWKTLTVEYPSLTCKLSLLNSAYCNEAEYSRPYKILKSTQKYFQIFIIPHHM